MGKAALRAANPLVGDIVRFTDAPERCIREATAAAASKDPDATDTRPQSPVSDTRADAEPPRHDVRAQRLIRAKRSYMHFEDLLRLGRVNLQTRSLLRWRANASNAATLERSLCGDASRPIAALSSALNPSSPLWDADLYLRTLHARTNRDGLLKGRTNVANLVGAIDAQSDALRLACFPSVCLVAAELQTTRKLACVDAKTRGREAASFARAEVALARTYANVTARQKAVARLRRVLDVLDRFDWVFSLGARMRAAGAMPTDALERLAREYARGREWVEAQRNDAPAVMRVREDLYDGVRHLADFLTDRLGAPAASRVAMKRIVAVLAAIECEGYITKALELRMEHAREKLGGSSTAGALASPRFSGGDDTTFTDGDASGIVKSATVAFLSGLSTYWRLAVVVSLFESCAAHVNRALPALVAKYVEVVEEVIGTNGSRALPRDAVVDVLRAHSVASGTLKVPKDYIARLRLLAASVASDYVKQSATAVQNSARNVAIAVAEARVDARAAAYLVRAVVSEALTQAEEVVRRRLKDDDDDGGVHLLRSACCGAHATAARALGELVASADTGSAGAALALRAAVFCAAARRGALDNVRDVVDRMLGECEDENESEEADIDTLCAAGEIDEARIAAVHAYVFALAPALEHRARRVVEAYAGQGDTAFEQATAAAAAADATGGSSSRGGVSAAAVELLLELALAALDARRRGAGADVARDVAGELVARVGAALREAAAEAILAPHHARLVRADCDFLAAALATDSVDALALAGFTEAANTAAGAADGKAVNKGGSDDAVAEALRHVKLIRLCLDGDEKGDPLAGDTGVSRERAENVR